MRHLLNLFGGDALLGGGERLREFLLGGGAMRCGLGGGLRLRLPANGLRFALLGGERRVIVLGGGLRLGLRRPRRVRDRR